MSDAVDLDAPQPDDPAPEWVPVEHRFAGLDRRTIAPALGVLAFLLFLTFGLPFVNAAISAEDPVEAGDVMRVGSGVTFVPAVGWNVEQGLRVAEETGSAVPLPAVLTQGTVEVIVSVDAFDGTPAELLDLIDSTKVGIQDIEDFQLVTDQRTVTTTSGIQGVASGFTGVGTEGVLAAFVVDGHGIEVIAYGSHGDLLQYADDIEAMIDSIAYMPVAPVAS
jgi:hypothetical protein